jgi:hypothetical protein
MDADQVGFRLLSLSHPMCPGFHVDRVNLRLVYTYAGPGTEWLEHHSVNRQWLGNVDRTFLMLNRPCWLVPYHFQ